MALCRYAKTDGSAAYALYRPGQICPLENVTSEVPSGAELFSKGGDWLSSLSEPQESQWIEAPGKLLLPVPLPEKVFCIGLNYRDHAIETGAEIPTEPVVFSKFNSTLIGHGDSIQLPKVSDRVDYEAELVVVIGREAKHVPASNAMDYVFGYACGHDVSARDWQKGRPGGQWLLGKTFDTFAPVGPCVVTSSEASLISTPTSAAPSPPAAFGGVRRSEMETGCHRQSEASKAPPSYVVWTMWAARLGAVI